MTLQIELSDAVLQAAWDAWTDYPANLSTPRAHMALQATIIAALEAMVEEGMATIVECTDVDDKVRPTLIIRLDGGKA